MNLKTHASAIPSLRLHDFLRSQWPVRPILSFKEDGALQAYQRMPPVAFHIQHTNLSIGIEQDILTCNAPFETYDIIVSNPPYITESEKAMMEHNVLDYEPAAALFVPDCDPMRFYRPIAAYAARALKSGGRLYLEINRGMAQEVSNTLRVARLSNIHLYTDFNGNNRFITATKIND